MRDYVELTAELERFNMWCAMLTTVAVVAVWYLFRLAVRNQPEIIILPRKGDAVVSYSASPIRRMVDGDL